MLRASQPLRWPPLLLQKLRTGQWRLPQARSRTRGCDWPGLRHTLAALPPARQQAVRGSMRGAICTVPSDAIEPWRTAAAGRRLPQHGEAALLARAARDRFGRIHWLQPAAARALVSLASAAHAEGIELEVVSSFRSVRDQARIVARKLAQGQSMEQILAVNAPPGYSEHHTGCAVDFAVPGAPLLTEAFEDSAAFSWLLSNAVR
ncbi:MAG: D-alanyl-D-alanine carboxypeptidase family protein, partial [Rhodanobacteraceae bacterium]|nr:D-alanyl-D-alanine carboxypeptidase family protein [Rhodanobacteraceae bacterium]